jgi:hypothetical protein
LIIQFIHIGLEALTELNPARKWNFVKVNIYHH